MKKIIWENLYLKEIFKYALTIFIGMLSYYIWTNGYADALPYAYELNLLDIIQIT